MRRCFFLLTILACFFSVTVLHAADSTPKQQGQTANAPQQPAAQATIMLTLDDLKQAILPDVMEQDKKEWLQNKFNDFSTQIELLQDKNNSSWEIRIAKLESKNADLISRTNYLLTIIAVLAAIASLVVLNVHNKAKEEIDSLKRFYKIELAELKNETSKSLRSINIEGKKQLTKLIHEASNSISEFLEKELQKNKDELEKYRTRVETINNTLKEFQTISKQQETKLSPEQSKQLEEIATSNDLPTNIKESSNIIKLFDEEKWLEAYTAAKKLFRAKPNADNYYMAASSAYNYAQTCVPLSADALYYYEESLHILEEYNRVGGNLDSYDYDLWGAVHRQLANFLDKKNVEDELLKSLNKLHKGLDLEDCHTAIFDELAVSYQGLFNLSPESYIDDFSNMLEQAVTRITPEKALEFRRPLIHLYLKKAAKLPEQNKRLLLKKALEHALHSEAQKEGYEAYNLSCISCQLGEHEKSRNWLELALMKNEIPSYDHLAADEDLFPLHDYQWFQDILNTMKEMNPDNIDKAE